MSLKSLAFTVLPSSTRSPVDARRMKTIERLQEQKQLVENPNHVRVVKKWVTINGQKQLVEKERRVHPWWRTATNGSLVFFIRLGGKPVVAPQRSDMFSRFKREAMNSRGER